MISRWWMVQIASPLLSGRTDRLLKATPQVGSAKDEVGDTHFLFPPQFGRINPSNPESNAQHSLSWQTIMKGLLRIYRKPVSRFRDIEQGFNPWTIWFQTLWEKVNLILAFLVLDHENVGSPLMRKVPSLFLKFCQCNPIIAHILLYQISSNVKQTL